MNKRFWKNNKLCNLLDIEYPIIQAPMAGVTTPELVAAASNSGVLGSHGCAMIKLTRICEDMKEINEKTNGSVNMNFFSHFPPNYDNKKITKAQTALNVWYEKFNLLPPQYITEMNYPFNSALCDAVCLIMPKVISFHFGLPEQELVSQIKKVGIIIMSTATSVEEALWLEKNGADIIIAQGYEAGGHSGWFLPRNGANLTGSFALIPRVVDAVKVPVIAAGGIADGRGIAAALMLGADGVQIGTAFVTVPESAASIVHKKALQSASGDDTILTKVFSGRYARTVANSFSIEMDENNDWPDFPLMNTLTGPLREFCELNLKGDALALWSGQAVGLNRSLNASELIEKLIEETNYILDF